MVGQVHAVSTLGPKTNKMPCAFPCGKKWIITEVHLGGKQNSAEMISHSYFNHCLSVLSLKFIWTLEDTQIQKEWVSNNCNISPTSASALGS